MGRVAEEFEEMTARISLARRSFSAGGCSMMITEDVRNSHNKRFLKNKRFKLAWNKKQKNSPSMAPNSTSTRLSG